MSALDQSLDDILASKPRNRGIRKGRRGLRVNRAAVNRGTAAKPSTSTAKPVSAVTQNTAATLFDQGSKIIVSNLPSDVSEQQIKDLFSVQIGKVSRISLAYGPTGASKGIATIQFAQKGDAKRAYDRYDGKLIDNKKRLKVEIIMDPSRTNPSLAARIQQAPIVSVPATRPKSTRARGRGRGRGGPSGAGRRPKKTVADLDAEMTDYFQDNTGAVATT